MFREIDIQVFTLDGEGIAFGIDLHSDCPGNALQIFTVGAEKDMRHLEVLKDDLFDGFLVLLFQKRTFAPVAYPDLPATTRQIVHKYVI
jgi:hypothetical protein